LRFSLDLQHSSLEFQKTKKSSFTREHLSLDFQKEKKVLDVFKRLSGPRKACTSAPNSFKRSKQCQFMRVCSQMSPPSQPAELVELFFFFFAFFFFSNKHHSSLTHLSREMKKKKRSPKAVVMNQRTTLFERQIYSSSLKHKVQKPYNCTTREKEKDRQREKEGARRNGTARPREREEERNIEENLI